MAKKHTRKYIISHAHDLAALYEALSAQLPAEDSYGRGLLHGYEDALSHISELLKKEK